MLLSNIGKLPTVRARGSCYCRMGAVSSQGYYREAELEAASGIEGLSVRDTGWFVDLAVRASVNGLLITDASVPENPIVYVNPAFEHMTGFSAAEALGKNCRFSAGRGLRPARPRGATGGPQRSAGVPGGPA